MVRLKKGFACLWISLISQFPITVKNIVK
jgi:hypothetical protein